METDGEQNQQGASANGSPSSGTSTRPSAMNSMSLYERQAVQVGGVSVRVDKKRTCSPCLLLAGGRHLAALARLCLCSMIYVRVSRRNEAVTCAELMEAFVIFTPLGHKTQPSVFFAPVALIPPATLDLPLHAAPARTSGSWQEVLFRSSPLPLLAAHFFMLAFFTPLCFSCCCFPSVLLPSSSA